MKDKKQRLTIFVISILVLTIGLSYAYYSAVVQGTGNANAEASGKTATIGEVEFNGENTFDTTNIGRDIYPGFIGVQEFTVGPYKDGIGIYEINLEATVPEAFGNDIKLTVYKTSDKTNNNIESEEGTLSITNNRYTKKDILNITGTLEKVYEKSLTTTTETIIEQEEFVIANNAFATPVVTPDGYYTYYAVYEYLDNGNQNEQQGLDFSSKITVRYAAELVVSDSLNTLQSLQALNSSIALMPTTTSNPKFSRIAPQSTPGINYQNRSLDSGVNSYITYASDFTYDESTGQYTLVDYTTCKYSECPQDMIGKYAVVSDSSWYGSRESTPIYQSIAKFGHRMIKIDAMHESKIDVTLYIGPELNEVKNGTWQPQISGLYALQDDYGTSYYFRGDIDYNYVKFGTWQTDYYNAYVRDLGKYKMYTSYSECEAAAGSDRCSKVASEGDDMYWRIIRINGDGSIRLIYDGTKANGKEDEEDTFELFRSIGEGGISQIDYEDVDNAYIGYMTGTTNATNYEAAHANNNDSNIKTILENWYQNQLINNDNYISDTLFCNDRSLADENTTIFTDNTFRRRVGFTQNAFGTNSALYAPYGRIIEEVEMNLGNKAILTCPQKNDAFTVSDTTNGNGNLTYPIGLITSDEINIAGGTNEKNYNYYLKSGHWFWTLSPAYFDHYVGNNNYESNDGFIIDIASNGDISYDNVPEDMDTIRPVINIKPGSINAGDGTASNPFIIE